jgi:hypothetical protein
MYMSIASIASGYRISIRVLGCCILPLLASM